MAGIAALAAMSSFPKEILNAGSVSLTETPRKSGLVTFSFPSLDAEQFTTCWFAPTGGLFRFLCHAWEARTESATHRGCLEYLAHRCSDQPIRTGRCRVEDSWQKEEEVGLNQELDEVDPTPLPDTKARSAGTINHNHRAKPGDNYSQQESAFSSQFLKGLVLLQSQDSRSHIEGLLRLIPAQD